MESLDTHRISSTYGAEAVQVFTALKLALPGIDVTYYGSEIGMENTYVRPDRVQDKYDSGGQRNVGSRDSSRSPMQWNDKPNAGPFVSCVYTQSIYLYYVKLNGINNNTKITLDKFPYRITVTEKR